MTIHAPEVDVEAAGERVSAILHPNGADKSDSTPSNEQQRAQLAQGATRKQRKDAGKPREPKTVETRLGKLTETEANRLRILLEDVIAAEKSYWAADANRCKAGIAYNAFVDELRAK